MPEPDKIIISVEQASVMAENCIRMNHLNTLVQREIAARRQERATELSERARVRAWNMFNELVSLGAKKPDGYCEPDEPA